MELSDVIALARAGYTREEIAALNKPAAPAAEVPAPAWAEALNTSIAALTQRITAINIGGAIPASQPQTVDSILAEIIAPQPKK